MSVGVDTLPWSALKLHETEVPWDDLNALADAAIAPDVRRRLMRELDQHLEARYRNDVDCFSDFLDLAVPAVLALSADRIDEAGRQEFAQYLVELLKRAGENDDDFLLEAIERAAGRFGTAMIDPVIALFEKHGQEIGCWFHAWGLLGVTRNATLERRQPVIDLCLRMIDTLPGRYARYSRVVGPALLLADIAPEQALPPIKKLASQSKCNDIHHLLDVLEGTEPPPSPEFLYAWFEPIEEWLPRNLQSARNWYEAIDDLELDVDIDGDELMSQWWEHLSDGAPAELRDTRNATPVDWDDVGLVQTPIARAARTVGRNEPCPCGSGLKFKKCCGRPN